MCISVCILIFLCLCLSTFLLCILRIYTAFLAFYQFKTKKNDLKASSHVSQAAVVLQGVQNFDARLPLQGIGQQQAATGTQHRGHALDEELGFFEGGARLDAEDEVEGILGKRGRGPTKIPSGNLT